MWWSPLSSLWGLYRQVIKAYQKLLRDVGNVSMSTLTANKPMGTARRTKPRPVRFVLLTDTLILSEPKEGYDFASTEPNSQVVLQLVDLAQAKPKRYVVWHFSVLLRCPRRGANSQSLPLQLGACVTLRPSQGTS